MRVLRDECVPRPLKAEFRSHEVRTVGEMGWAGLKNGALLERAAEHFDALFTVDRDFAGPPQETGSTIVLLILTIGSTDPSRLRPHIPEALDALARARPGEVVVVAP